MRFADLKRALVRPRRLPWDRPRRRRRARGRRGIALVMVLGSLAILTSVAVEFLYQSSIDLRLAVNGRDELRADYLARSSVNMSRLLLRFQKQLDGQTKQLGGLLSSLGMAGAGGGAPNIRLWELVPIDCSLFNMLLGGGAAPAAPAEAPKFGEGLASKGEAGKPLASFGDYEGCFSAQITDEEQKINVNKLNAAGASGRAAMMQALILMADPRFEWVYEKADAHGVKQTAQETIIALHDWIDERDTGANLNLTSGADPFPDGFGDENRNYASKYPFRYRSKNASFDTLDELYQVDGVSDLFMAAFRDRLTVYADKNMSLNVNTDDENQEYLNIVTVAANEADPKLNPAGLVIQAIRQEIRLTKMFSFLGMNTATFVGIVERNGIAIKPEIKGNIASNRWVDDKVQTFTVKATGQAGKVQRTVTAVIRSDDVLGKFLYYRQE